LKKRVADQIVERCSVISDTVFMVTGGGSMHLNDAFTRSKKFNVYYFHHEQAAAIAAEGFYRAAGKPAIINVTTGPGGINALNGIYGAYVDSVPIVVISGQVKRETMSKSYALPLRQLGDQEADIIDMVKGITKYSVTLMDAADLDDILDRALFLTLEGRPGPVWIDVPVDIQGTTYIDKPRQPNNADFPLHTDPNVSENTKRGLLHRRMDEKGLTECADYILDAIRNSSSPALLLGNGVWISRTTNEIRSLARELRIPALTGWNAHDIIPNEHPCFVGRPGTVGDRAGNFCLQSADLLVVLGARLNIRQISYNFRSFAKNAKIVMVDADPSELEKPTLRIHKAFCIDLADLVPVLLKRVDVWSEITRHSRFLAWCRERVMKYPVVRRDRDSKPDCINPYDFIDTLFKNLNDDATIVAGNGTACVVGFQAAYLRTGQRFFTNSGAASMGYDLPAAIGASIASEKGVVFCLAGDGSIMMNIQELQTVVTYRLPLKIIIINNMGYQSIKITQETYFPDNLSGFSSATGLGFPDFGAVAKAFGIPSIRINNMSDWSCPESQNLLNSQHPVLFDVSIDPSQGFEPKLMSKKLEDGSMVSPELQDMFPFLTERELEDNTWRTD